MVLKGFVELRGHSPKLRQSRPRNNHQVVMFIMVANIECNQIQRTVIRLSLLSIPKYIVLMDKMRCNRMQTVAPIGRQCQVEDCAAAQIVINCAGECELKQKIKNFEFVGSLHKRHTACQINQQIAKEPC